MPTGTMSRTREHTKKHSQYTRGARHAPERSHVLADLEFARVGVDAAGDRVVAEESRLPAIHDDVIEERTPITT